MQSALKENQYDVSTYASECRRRSIAGGKSARLKDRFLKMIRDVSLETIGGHSFNASWKKKQLHKQLRLQQLFSVEASETNM